MLLKARYVGETLGENNTIEVRSEDLMKYVPFELEIYIRNYVIEAYRRMDDLSSQNALSEKVIVITPMKYLFPSLMLLV